MPRKRCGYLVMEDPGGFSIDADLAFPHMEAMGWDIEGIRWRADEPDWNDYDAVYIGVPWDYPQDPDRFMEILADIDRSGAILVNDIALVHWSLPKTYLRDLEARGADIVPSEWLGGVTAGLLDRYFEHFETDRLIVKPVVSTNATDTYVLTRERLPQVEGELCRVFEERALVVQPFIDSILTEGEYSLFYFNRELSHATVKVPKAGDFRVQEEYGADLRSIEPEPALVETGNRVMAMVEPMPVYARADFVRGRDGRFLVMELELIEPSMYLRMDAEAPERFARAFDSYYNDKKGEG